VLNAVKKGYNSIVLLFLYGFSRIYLKVETQDLRSVGLKVTLPRIKILEILEKQTEVRHLTAEQVYKVLLNENEEIGLATVYRVLTQFEAAGLVTRQHFEGGNSVFELNRGDHHDHIVCVKCGRIDEFIDQTIEKRQKQIAKELGYVLTDHSLCLYGFCSSCK
jgi:Fur family ferric uptake transcriptional regulator